MNREMAATLGQLGDFDLKHVHLVRFVGGVIYALSEYDRIATTAPKQTLSDQSHSDELKHLLNAIRDSVAPPPNWLRGFFYNAAVMRLDAAWERSLRAILQDKTTKCLKKLYNKVRESDSVLPEYDKSMCKPVREEVNALKHQDKGPSKDTREHPEVVWKGLKQLVDLLNRNSHKLAV